MPLLAMAAEIIATCRGVTRTSYWPMADWASWGWLSSAGTELGVTVIGTDNRSPMPNFAAWARKSSAPTCMPSHPNAVLQEISSACVRLVLLLGPQLPLKSLGRSALVCGRSSTAGPGIWLSSVNLPDSSAAAAVTILKVDPGG